MTGTTVNAVTVLLGGLIGLSIKKGLPDKIEKTVTLMLGLSVGVIGLGGIITSMITVGEGGKLSSSGELLLFLSLVIGSSLGTWWDVDGALDRLGKRIEARVGTEGFSKGFISASLLFCVGAMAIIGSLNDGLRGDSSILLIKSALDGITSIVLGSSLGVGVAFSAVPVFLYQGAISLGAGYIAPYISDPMLNSVCLVGYVIVLCIGINFFEVIKIKTANMLPALLVPIVYQLVVAQIK